MPLPKIKTEKIETAVSGSFSRLNPYFVMHQKGLAIQKETWLDDPDLQPKETPLMELVNHDMQSRVVIEPIENSTIPTEPNKSRATFSLEHDLVSTNRNAMDALLTQAGHTSDKLTEIVDKLSSPAKDSPSPRRLYK